MIRMFDSVIHRQNGSPGVTDQVNFSQIQFLAYVLQIVYETVERYRILIYFSCGVPSSALIVEYDFILLRELVERQHMDMVETGSAMENDDGFSGTKNFIVKLCTVTINGSIFNRLYVFNFIPFLPSRSQILPR